MMALYLQTDFTPAADVETEETVAEDAEETTETTAGAEITAAQKTEYGTVTGTCRFLCRK